MDSQRLPPHRRLLSFSRKKTNSGHTNQIPIYNSRFVQMLKTTTTKKHIKFDNYRLNCLTKNDRTKKKKTQKLKIMNNKNRIHFENGILIVAHFNRGINLTRNAFAFLRMRSVTIAISSAFVIAFNSTFRTTSATQCRIISLAKY